MKNDDSIYLPDFSKVRAIVLGDIMLDSYFQGSASRISPEAPVPVVRIEKQVRSPGGAGNVALNMRHLGCQLDLFALVGHDEDGDYLKNRLESEGITCHFGYWQSNKTIKKLRVLDRNQQLIRLDFEPSKQSLQQEVLPWLEDYDNALHTADVVVISDYAKGTLQQVDQLIAMAKRRNVPVFVDPKRCDCLAYRGATLIKPNLNELEQMVGLSSLDQMLAKATELMLQCECEALLVTRGKEGVSLLRPNHEPLHLPAKQLAIYDVTGAGDTIIATLSAAFATGLNWPNAVSLANLAAGLVIRKLGSASVSPLELHHALRSQHSQASILTLPVLLEYIRQARACGEKIIMTNGCFDLLHAGHIQYLEQAKALGHRLIIAVNDDRSVKRIKGESRPINGLQHRMRVLAALRTVDWVVSFSEDTPYNLIKAVRPDILVKGGDYQEHQIVGAELVKRYGGKVLQLPFKKNCSTTAILERIAL